MLLCAKEILYLHQTPPMCTMEYCQGDSDFGQGCSELAVQWFQARYLSKEACRKKLQMGHIGVSEQGFCDGWPLKRKWQERNLRKNAGQLQQFERNAITVLFGKVLVLCDCWAAGT